MRITMTYDVRGEKVTTIISLPSPTVDSLTHALERVAWVAGQTNPRVTVE